MKILSGRRFSPLRAAVELGHRYSENNGVDPQLKLV